MFFATVTCTICVSCAILWVHHYKRRHSHPPGPLGFPIVEMLAYQIVQTIFSNYLPKFSQLKYLIQMKEKYGDYWSMEMGGRRFVILASWKIVNEAFLNNGQLFSGRSPINPNKRKTERKGILFANNEIWKENRHMALKTLKKFGMGKRNLEDQIINEGNYLISYLESISSSPIKTSTSFAKAISNIISLLVFNESNNYEDPDFEDFVQNSKVASQSGILNLKLNIFLKFFRSKFGRYIFPDVDKYFSAWSSLRNFVSEKCMNKIKLQNKELPDCVFDYFWRYRYQNDPDIKDEEKFQEILFSMLDLYSAGSETTNNIFRFSCLMLGCHQDVQNDLRKELRILTDDHSKINMDMKMHCPKLASFMDEIHRFCCAVTTIFRSVTEPCIFMGYKLYPNDIIFGDIFTISRDPDLFPNPYVFDPYRFMDTSNTRYIPNKSFIPFGIGKRICPGEAIAKMEIFLMLSRIIHRFHIILPKETLDNIDDVIDGYIGLTHGPLEHVIYIEKVHE